MANAAATRFRIPADEVQQALRSQDLSTEQYLQSLLEPSTALARSPISGYKVAAAGLAGSGSVYIGVNLEFPGVPLNNSVHAEQFLVAMLHTHGEEELRLVAVNAAPCGHCRQFFCELARADSVRFIFPAHDSSSSSRADGPNGAQHQTGSLASSNGSKAADAANGAAAASGTALQSYSLQQLLPMRFGPEDLLDLSKHPPLLLQQQQNRVSAVRTPAAVQGISQELQQAACKAAVQQARASFCPYTRCPAGVALLSVAGEVYSGCYMENAAFNPGLLPLQAALVHAVSAGVDVSADVVLCVLAEVPKTGKVQHVEIVQALMKSIAPQVPICLFELQQEA